MESVDGLMVRNAEQDEVRKCTPFVVGHRYVIAWSTWEGTTDMGNLDVDDWVIFDKAYHGDIAVGEIAGALRECKECCTSARSVTARSWSHGRGLEITA